MRGLGWLAGLSAVALLAGCSGDQEQSENIGLENEAAASAEANPFAEVEQRMNQAMMSAVGSDIGDTWGRKIIVHHQGAIDMSEAVLAQNPPPEVAELARMTIDKQRKDQEDIRKLLKEGAADPSSAEPYRSAVVEMQQGMQAATGAGPAETYMRKMLAHHRGGVALSDVALENGVSGALRTQVQKTRDEQQKDAQMVEAMLRGESMSHAMEQSGATSAQQAQRESAPADAAPAATTAAPRAPKAAPKPAPAAETKAPSEPSAPECLPEHRAAGHC